MAPGCPPGKFSFAKTIVPSFGLHRGQASSCASHTLSSLTSAFSRRYLARPVLNASLDSEIATVASRGFVVSFASSDADFAVVPFALASQ